MRYCWRKRASESRVWLSPYLLFAALSSVFLQTNGPASCETGDATLSELAVIVNGEDQLVFTAGQRRYELWLRLDVDGALVRAIPTDPAARVWIDVFTDLEHLSAMAAVVGGGEASVPLRPGLNTLQVYVKTPGGASYSYEASIRVEGGLATAGWQVSEPLATPTPAWGFEDSSAHSSGYAVVLWDERVGDNWELAAARFAPGDGWQPPELVGRDSTIHLDAEIAVGPQGDAVAVWRVGFDIWANRYRPDVGWGNAELIESESERAFAPRVVIDAEGTALAVWLRPQDDSLWFNRCTLADGWDVARPAHQGGAGSPTLAGTDSGEALLVWDANQDDSIAVWSRQYQPVIGWSDAEAVSAGGQNAAYSPNVAMAADGSAIAAWHQNEPTSDGWGRSSVWASRFTAASGWDAPQLVEDDDLDTNGDETPPSVAIGPNGHGFVAWSQWERDVNQEQRAYVGANRWMPGTGWGSAKNIGPEPYGSHTDPTEIQLLTDSAGNALAVWLQHASLASGRYPRVWYNRYRSSVGGWDAPEVVSEPPGSVPAQQYEPALIAGPQGTAQAIWMEYRGSDPTLQVSRFE